MPERGDIKPIEGSTDYRKYDGKRWQIMCNHNIQSAFCIFCKGSALCKHRKQKAFCIECGGDHMCKHGKQKAFCVECGGNALCEHLIQRCFCYLCDGSQICPGLMKDGGRCPHLNTKSYKFKTHCNECYYRLHPEFPRPKYYKSKETEVVKQHQKRYGDKEILWGTNYDKTANGGCSLRRPDIVMEFHEHVIIIEVDEYQHKAKSYTTSCEESRRHDLFADYGGRKIICIRFNPDGYNGNASPWKNNQETKGQWKICDYKEWNKRIKELWRVFDEIIENNGKKYKNQWNDIFLFYDDVLEL